MCAWYGTLWPLLLDFKHVITSKGRVGGAEMGSVWCFANPFIEKAAHGPRAFMTQTARVVGSDAPRLMETSLEIVTSNCASSFSSSIEYWQFGNVLSTLPLTGIHGYNVLYLFGGGWN